MAKKSDGKTKQNYIAILEAMQSDRWYKASELEESVDIKVSRIKVLRKKMTEQVIILVHSSFIRGIHKI